MLTQKSDYAGVNWTPTVASAYSISVKVFDDAPQSAIAVNIIDEYASVSSTSWFDRVESKDYDFPTDVHFDDDVLNIKSKNGGVNLDWIQFDNVTGGVWTKVAEATSDLKVSIAPNPSNRKFELRSKS